MTAPLNEGAEPLREQIRMIWRPLYNAGFAGSVQIHAQEMAYLISAAVDETEQLIATAERAARIDALKLLIDTFETTGKRVTLDRIKQFQAGQLIAQSEISTELSGEEATDNE